MSAAPIEGITRCPCGAKYWDKIGENWICHSCGVPFVFGPQRAIERTPENMCYTCTETPGKAARGWSGDPSLDGETCPDCKGTGIDQTQYGTGADHCPHCASDWKRPHRPGCRAAR